MVSKHHMYVSTKVDRRTWVNVPLGIYGPPAVTPIKLTRINDQPGNQFKKKYALKTSAGLAKLCQGFHRWMMNKRNVGNS